MGQIPSWKADGRTSKQEIPRRLWDTNVHQAYRVCKRPSLGLFLSITPVCMTDFLKHASFVEDEFLRERKIKWARARYFDLLTVPGELIVTWHVYVSHCTAQWSAIAAVTKLHAPRPRKDFTPPYRAALSQQYSGAIFATVWVLSYLHSSGLRCTCCNSVRLFGNLEGCNFVTVTIIVVWY
jgi:hypothetical protein